MTYCVGVKVNAGLVFASDSRTNAGVDQVSTYSKMHVFERPGERVFVVLSAGNLATSQAVIHSLRREFKDSPYNGNWPLFYFMGPNCSFYGLEFVYDRPGTVFVSNPAQSGLVVSDCAFRGCNLGWYFTEALIRDCRFDGGGATIAPDGLYLRCKFIGPGVQHAWNYWGQQPVAMIDGSFVNTDRGPCFNLRGDLAEFLCVGLTCSGINRTPNGNEILLAEATGPSRFTTS